MLTKTNSTRNLPTIFILVILVLLLTRLGLNTYSHFNPPQAIVSDNVRDYLAQVFAIIEKKSLKRTEIDMSEFKRQTLIDAANAQIPSDAYPAIRKALIRLGDHHSQLVEPQRMLEWNSGHQNHTVGLEAEFPAGTIIQVYPNSAAVQAGIQVGDRLLTLDDQPLEQLSNETFAKLLYTNSPEKTNLKVKLQDHQDNTKTLTLAFGAINSRLQPQGRLMFGNIGYIELPGQSANGEAVEEYAVQTQALIRELDNSTIEGWIIDLRRNEGGNMWPMLAGIGPILGEGMAGEFVSQGDPSKWGYQEGKIFNGESIPVRVNPPYKLKKSLPPVAILTSIHTASSGEAVVVSFHGRPNTRFFGEPTYGVPTANIGYPLKDGATLLLTIAIEADRTGKTYDSSIPPDQKIPIDWRKFATEQDPVIITAQQWLKQIPLLSHK